MPGEFRVTVLDAAGEPATAFRGTIVFTSTDPAARLPEPYTFTQADRGTKSFAATSHGRAHPRASNPLHNSPATAALLER